MRTPSMSTPGSCLTTSVKRIRLLELSLSPDTARVSSQLSCAALLTIVGVAACDTPVDTSSTSNVSAARAPSRLNSFVLGIDRSVAAHAATDAAGRAARMGTRKKRPYLSCLGTRRRSQSTARGSHTKSALANAQEVDACSMQETCSARRRHAGLRLQDGDLGVVAYHEAVRLG